MSALIFFEICLLNYLADFLLQTRHQTLQGYEIFPTDIFLNKFLKEISRDLRKISQMYLVTLITLSAFLRCSYRCPIKFQLYKSDMNTSTERAFLKQITNQFQSIR